MTREETLDKAKAVITKDRNDQYGKDDTWIDIAGYAACGAEVMEVQE